MFNRAEIKALSEKIHKLELRIDALEERGKVYTVDPWAKYGGVLMNVWGKEAPSINIREVIHKILAHLNLELRESAGTPASVNLVEKEGTGLISIKKYGKKK